MKLCVIPIDNRPVCYNLVKEITNIDNSIELFIPPRNLLGGLKKDADIVGLYSWLNQLPKVDTIVMSMDTIAYGGLIPSRRCPDSFEDIYSRIHDFKEVLETKNVTKKKKNIGANTENIFLNTLTQNISTQAV